MVTIGGNEHGSAHPVSTRSPLLARMAGTLAAAALIATGSSAFAVSPPNPTTASQVAVTSAGPGPNINGASLSSIEVFKAKSAKNAAPSQYLHGSAVGLLNPTDIKYSPGNNFFAVSNSATGLGGIAAFGGATNLFSAAANGNQTFVQSLPSQSTYIPDGVSWDADGDLWVADLATPSCVLSLPGQPPTTGGPSTTCTTGVATNKPPTPPSADLCSVTVAGKQVNIVGTIEEFVPNGASLAAPNVMFPIPVRTIKTCGAVSKYDPTDIVSSGIFAPVGILVSPGETGVQVCVPTDYPKSYGCGAFGGRPAYELGNGGVVYTHAVVVVDSATAELTVYEPELEEAIGNEFGAGEGLITKDFGSGVSTGIIEAMAPLGGVLGSGDFVNPQYVAAGAISNSGGPQLLVTDVNGGPFKRGSVVSIPTYVPSAPVFCAQPFGPFVEGECDVFTIGGTLVGKTPSFIEANSNKHVKDVTGLTSPEGIAALVSSNNVLTQIFVANPLTGSFYQFAGSAAGNAAPQTTVGGNTNISKMVFPWGLTIPNTEVAP